MWTLSRLPDTGNSSSATFVHQCFQREIWQEAKLGERVSICAALPLVPFVVAVLTAIFTTLNGQAIKKRTGKGIIRQLPRANRSCVPGAILPPWYYIFELHDDDKRRHAREYVNRFEMKGGLYRILRDQNGGLPLPTNAPPGASRTSYASCLAAVNLASIRSL